MAARDSRYNRRYDPLGRRLGLPARRVNLGLTEVGMGKAGTLSGVVHQMVTTVQTNVSILTVEQKLQDVEKANQALSKRWQEMLGSEEVQAYRANKNLDDWNQTQLIIDVENLVGKLAAVVIAQQSALTAVVGALKQLNKK